MGSEEWNQISKVLAVLRSDVTYRTVTELEISLFCELLYLYFLGVSTNKSRRNQTRSEISDKMFATVCLIFCALLSFVDLSASAPRPPPIFSSSQRKVTAAFGTQVRLPCRVTDPSKIARYWWTRNGNQIKKSRKYRPKKFRYLRIKNVDGSDAGDYVCWAMNAGGKIQQTITLNVEGEVEDIAPYFTEKSKMKKPYFLLPASHKLKIVCSASGVPQPTVIWYKNGQELKHMPDDQTPLTPSSFVITFSSLRPKDTGKYKCQVSNRAGNITMTYTLKVKASVPPPTFSSSQRNVTAAFGTEVRLPCRVTDPSKTARHWWTRNGNEIKKSRKYRPKKFRYLRIKNVDRSDAGDYVCWAMNAGGKIQQTITLNVEGEVEGKLKPRGQPGKGRPWFVKAQPEQQFIAWPASRDLKLRCRADGEPPLKYQWLKDGKVLKYRRLDRKFNDTRWYLRIKTAVPSDNGLYKCIVSNRLGNISSHNIELTVAEKGPVRPILSAQYPLNKTARIGDNVTFQCIELFSPILTDYRWLHWKKLPPSYPDLEFDDNSPSMNSSYYTMINPRYYQPFQVHKEEGKYGGRVLLYNVTKEDEGMYTCLISNHLGLSWRSAFLRVFSSEFPIGLYLIKFPILLLTSNLSIAAMHIEVFNIITQETASDKESKYDISSLMHELVLSSEASVPPPTFSSSQRNVTAAIGTDVRLPCRVTDPSKTAKHWWTRNGNEIKKSRKYRPKKFRYLKIKNVDRSDAGDYVCWAKNAGGKIQQTITLNVENPHFRNSTEDIAPYFTEKSKMKKSYLLIPASHKLKIVCSASGVPRPTVIWYKDGQELKHMPDDQTPLTPSNFVIAFSSLRPKDTGKYKCQVSNRAGNITMTYTLQVKEMITTKPVLLSMDNITAYEGDNVTATCKAVSDGLPHFQFALLENGTFNVLDPGLSPEDYVWKSNKVRWHGVNLRLVNVTRKDERNYYCMVGDDRGFDYVKFYIKVLPRPVTPEAKSIASKSNPPQETGETDQNSTLAIIIVVCVAAVTVLLGSGLAWYCIFRRDKTKKNAGDIEAYGAPPYPGKRRDPLSSTSSSMSNCSTNPLLERHSIRYLKRQNSSLSHVSEMVLHCDAEWEIDRENLNLLEVIGEGAFGKVLKAEAFGLNRQNMGKTIVAVKTLKDDATEADLMDLVSEMEVMKTIGRHKNIINVIGCCTQDGPLLVVVEYAPYGNLKEYLRERRPDRNGVTNQIEGEEKLNLRDFVSFSYQIARGMEYLSAKKCIHRDLAARNILVGEDKVMKIADFGLARDIHQIDYYRKTTDGRLPVKWMALEALFDRVYTSKSDVWSFGVVVWEIVTFGGSPYPSIPIEKLFELLQTGYRMDRPVNCPQDIYNLLLRCWKEEPYIRPTFTDLVEELDTMLSKMTNEEYVDMGELISPMQPHAAQNEVASSPSDSESNKQKVLVAPPMEFICSRKKSWMVNCEQRYSIERQPYLRNYQKSVEQMNYYNHWDAGTIKSLFSEWSNNFCAII
ncbi:fibroblast growth factor receptor 4-like, partial [Paramuricea clavata]